MNGASYIQKVLETWTRKSLISQAMSCERAFNRDLQFCALMFLEEGIRTSLVSTVHTDKGHAPLISRSCGDEGLIACTRPARLGSFKTAPQSYMFNNNCTLMSEIIGSFQNVYDRH